MYKRPIIEVSAATARVAGRFMEQLVSPIMTADIVNQILENNVLKKTGDICTFEDLNIHPNSMDRRAFDYLHRFRKGGHFVLVKGYH
jgi:hypothetical protein